MAVAVLTGSAAGELTAIFPTAPLATVSPGIWASENPSAAATFEAAFTSLVLANPTALPSDFASIITEVPPAAVTSVILNEESAFPTLFTSVALDIFYNAEPTTLKEVYATNPAAGSSFIASEFKTGDPSWYDAMPSAVKSYVEALATTTGIITGPTISGVLQPTVFKTVIQTVSAPPSTSSSASNGGGGSGTNGGGGSGGGGLSTGAQAGIGVGVGGAALMAIIAGLCFFLRRRKAKKHSTTSVAQQPEMAPAGAYHNNNQPQSPHQSQYYAGAPQPGPAGYYTQQEPKYDQAYGGTGVQPGPYQQPYQQSTLPPPQHNSQYYPSPPARYGSPPLEGFYNEKRPVATATGQPKPAVGPDALVSDVTGSSSGGHDTGTGTGAATELSAGRTSVESIRHEMPADRRQ